MNILLIGGNFKNKGAEAMILTAVRQLSARIPGANIAAASYAKSENFPYGNHVLDGCQFELIENSRNFFRPLQVLLLFLLGRSAAGLSGKYLRTFFDSDIVIDISGFALTDQRPLLRRFVYSFEIFTAWLFQKPFICFTQAMGPFEHPATRFLAKASLPKVSLIIARGASTLRYLEQLNSALAAKTIRSSDSAYLFAVGERVQTDDILESRVANGKPLFGIVPNINIYSRTFPQDENNPYIELLTELANFAVETLDANVVFVCHEHYADKKDDQWLADQVMRQVGKRDRMHCISATESAERLKAVIGKLDFVVASRFHSVVAAISKRVPFLSLGWSHKYKELVAETGLTQCVLDGRELTPEELIQRVTALWGERKSLATQLEAVVPTLESSAAEAFDAVAQRYGKK